MAVENNRAKGWPYLLVENKMLRDENFYKILSAKAQLLFIYLRSAYNPRDPDYDCINKATGKIQVKLAYSYISKINGFHSYATINKTLRELIENGWIEIAEQGGKYGSLNAYTFPNKYGAFKNEKKNPYKKKKKSR